jgi:hypothetical protein
MWPTINEKEEEKNKKGGEWRREVVKQNITTKVVHCSNSI